VVVILLKNRDVYELVGPLPLSTMAPQAVTNSTVELLSGDKAHPPCSNVI
jgi:hypothetical protein